MKRLLYVIIVCSLLQSCNSNTPPPNTDQPPNPWGMSWTLYSPFGIREPDNRFTTGRINGMAQVNASAIIAVSEFSGAWYIDNAVTMSLSKDWEHPRTRCITRIRGQKFVAGGYRTDFNDSASLYITDTTTQTPILSRWHRIDVTGICRINSMLFDSARNTIWLATNNGLWYATVPNTPTGAGFTFSRAGMPAGAGAAFQDVKYSANNTIVASHKLPAAGITASGLYYLDGASAISNGFTMATLPVGEAPRSSVFLGTTPAAPRTVFAWAADPGINRSTGIYKSTDGGRSYTRVTTNTSMVDNVPYSTYSFWRDAGDLERMGSIAIHRTDSNIIMLSAVNGPLISADGGVNFSALPNTGVHQDIHYTTFSQYHPNRFFIVNDGGITFCDADLRQPQVRSSRIPMNNQYNRRLPNLLCYSPTGRVIIWGNMAVDNGMVAVGLQDNDNVILTGPENPWKYIYDQPGRNDGGGVALPRNGILSLAFQDDMKYVQRDGRTTGTQQPSIRISVASGSTINFRGLFNASVTPPASDAASLIAIGCNAASDSIYGIYAGRGTMATAGLLLRSGFRPGEVASSLLTKNGDTIYMGTRGGGRIYKATKNMDGSYNIPSPTIPDANQWGSEIGKMSFYDDNRIVAIKNFNDTGDVLLETSHNNFTSVRGNLPQASVLSIAADTDTRRVYVAMQNGIYGCADITATNPDWIKVSTGLPTMPFCTDVAIGTNWQGTKTLFAATFGWSVWSCPLAPSR